MGGTCTPARVVVVAEDKGFLDKGSSCYKIPATVMAMLERLFWVSLRRTVDEVGGCNPGKDIGITGMGGGGTGTISTEAGTTGAGIVGW